MSSLAVPCHLYPGEHRPSSPCCPGPRLLSLWGSLPPPSLSFLCFETKSCFCLHVLSLVLSHRRWSCLIRCPQDAGKREAADLDQLLTLGCSHFSLASGCLSQSWLPQTRQGLQTGPWEVRALPFSPGPLRRGPWTCPRLFP